MARVGRSNTREGFDHSACLMFGSSREAAGLSHDEASAPKAVPPIAAVTSVADGKREVLKSCVASAMTETTAAIATAFHHDPLRPYENPNGTKSKILAITSRGRSAGSVNGIKCSRFHCGREVIPDEGKLMAQTTRTHQTHN